MGDKELDRKKFKGLLNPLELFGNNKIKIYIFLYTDAIFNSSGVDNNKYYCIIAILRQNEKPKKHGFPYLFPLLGYPTPCVTQRSFSFSNGYSH